MFKLLLIDDEKPAHITVRSGLAKHDYEVVWQESSDTDEVLKSIVENKPDAVLLDILFNGRNEGKRLLEEITTRFKKLPVIMLTNTMKEYKEADYPKAAFPYPKDVFRMGDAAFADLAKRIKVVINVKNVNEEDIVPGDSRFGFVFGSTPAMIGVCKTVLLAAQSDLSVLITGETGTGKELIATSIHNLSKRRGETKVSVNCASFQDTLLESELFGHEVGAFTDARQQKIGKFQLANNGTIFLDEIGDLSMPAQSKILRVLQEGTFERVGGTKTISVDIRVITATNKKLEEEIEKDAFRKDLFYRLNHIHIHLPPLRERLNDDFSRLYSHFVNKFGNKYNKIVTNILNDELLGAFRAYKWPGNIREFEKKIEKAVMTTKTVVLLPSDFDFQNRDNGSFDNNSVNDIVQQIWAGKLKWANLRDEFNKRSPRRAEIFRKLIDKWLAEKATRPTGEDLAVLLETTAGNVRQKLKECGLKLTDWPKSQ